MADIIVAGNTSGAITISAPLVAGSGTLTLPTGTDTLVGKATTDTLTNKTLTSATLTSPSISSAVMATMASSVITSGTAVATTSGTSIDFTGIPSWVKRITLMVSGLSTNGTSNQIVQLGVSGTPTTTGYLSSFVVVLAAPSVVSSTSGFTIVSTSTASGVTQGFATFCLLDASTNKWVYNSSIGRSDSTQVQIGGGVVTLAGTLNLLRLTTVNGTDTFDAGSVNILYE